MNSMLTIYTDGGARGNPGPAGIGATLKNKAGELVGEVSEYIGETTNNQAEYKAVIAAMDKAESLGALELDFYLDSLLVVEQLNGNYKVKNADLAPLFVQIHNRRLKFKKTKFSHVRREYNKEADALVNLALDKQLGLLK